MVAALTSFLLAEEGDDTEFLDLEVHGWQWAILGVAIVALLAIDLYRHREAHAPTFSEASKESAFSVEVSQVAVADELPCRVVELQWFADSGR